MSNENAKAPATADDAVEQEVLDMYKSMDISRRVDDTELLQLVIEEGVTPRMIRYGVMRNVRRGVVKSLTDELFYFNYAPGSQFKLIAADTDAKQWEASRLLQKCHLGCELAKAEDFNPDDEFEDIDKAPPPGGGGGGGGAKPPAPVREEQDLADQRELLTDKHPGGVGTSTPDDPNRGRNWHPDEPDPATLKGGLWSHNDLLKGLAANLSKSPVAAAVTRRQVTGKEAQFMQEELGRSPQDIASGNTYMSPTDRKRYNMWLNKSLGSAMSGLERWRGKNRG